MKKTFSMAAVALVLCLGLSTSQAAVEQLKAGGGPKSWSGDLAPISKGDWSYERAAHLLERAGFGGTPEEIEKLAAMTPEKAVGTLIDYESIDTSKLPKFIESGIYDQGMMTDIDTHLEFNDGLAKAHRTGEAYGIHRREDGGVRPYQAVVNMLYYVPYASRHEWNRASVWWGNRMVATPRPLEEKMTLFWHGHFATEQEKLRDYRLLIVQLDTLRTNATGNFRTILNAMAKDPAMLIYLDNRKNVKGHANENFAREVMELFALGIGNYTEDDIKEAARAFTGWTNYGEKFLLKPEQHDEGEKTILGKKGNFKGEDVIDILLAQKASAEFISRKLYRFFVREEISPELNAKLAESLRKNNYEFKPLLREMFLSKDFYSAPSFATHIKSPTEYLVSTYRKLGVKEMPGTPQFPVAVARLGQELGNPPNVKGWDGGRAWINPSTLMERGNIARHVLFPEEAGDAYFVGPFTERFERYQFAPAEVAKRDREAALGVVASAGAYTPEGAMMEAGAMKGSAPAKLGSEGSAMKDAGAMKLEVGGEAMMMAPSATMINKTAEYDLPLGVYNGMNKAFEKVLPIPATPAKLDVKAMAVSAGVKSVEDAVKCFERRFLSAPLSSTDRAAIVAFMKKRCGGETINLASPNTERDLRELIHLIMSTPEYQVG